MSMISDTCGQRRTDWRPIALGAIASALGAAAGAAAGAAQAVRPREAAEVEQLVVMIRCELDGAESIGAGIIVGADGDRLYIVTANHVMRLGAKNAVTVQVDLKALPGKPLPATVVTLDDKMDLAVLSIRRAEAAGLDLARIPFDRLGDPATLARGDGVYALGYPNGIPWAMNVAPAPVAATSDSLITFESSFVTVGNSGGALLNQRWEIIGLVQWVEPTKVTARSITQIVEILRGRRYPVALRGRFVGAALDVVSAGGGFTCSVRRSGAAHCWGANARGELGTGSRANGTSPMRVSGSLTFVSVSAGFSFACGLTSAGVAYCWGVLPGTDSLAWDPTARRVPTKVADDLTFTSLSAGYSHVCGVTNTSAVYCWGENDDGQLGNGSTTRSTRPVRVASDLTFTSVSAGGLHSCALATGGRAYCWGSGAHGALGNGSEHSSARPIPVGGGITFAAVSAGYLYTCGVTPAGAAHCWGYNEFGQLGIGTTRGAASPQAVAGGHVFGSVSASRTASHGTTCGATRAGAALCWGWTSEALGQGDIRDETVPGPVVGDLVFQTVSVGFSHACGVLTDGDVYCWGNNEDGQLGDGSTITRLTPAVVPIPP